MNNSYRPIQVILADDHEIFRDGFSSLVKKTRKVEIIAEASNGLELVLLARKLNPDVVITDIKMPEQNGIEATIQLKKEMPHIGIIALSMFDEDDLIVEMLEAGASGYLLKNAHKHELLAAIEAVFHNQTYYCSDTTKKLSRMIAESKYDPFHKKPKPVFSENELIVIKMVCEEYANQDIADAMELSRRTVEGYRESILKKIHAKNTAGIVVYAIKNKLFELSGSGKL